MTDQPSPPVVMNSFTFDPTNKYANLSFYKQINTPGPGIPFNVTMVVPIDVNETETIANVRKHAAKAAIKWLQEIINVLEQQG
ncbi:MULTISPECIES: hypothetical protein [unclassified Bradyrhizobium]